VIVSGVLDVDGGVFFSNKLPIEDLPCGVVAIGGETDEVERSLFMEEKSAEDEDGGRGVPPDKDLGVRSGPTHCRM